MTTGLMEGIYTQEERERLAEQEYNRLDELYESLDDSKRKLIDKQLHQAAFLYVTLEELQFIIRRDGVTDTYQNGPTQHGTKPSSAVQTYDKLQNTYNKLMLQLRKELPEREGEGNDLMLFINNHDAWAEKHRNELSENERASLEPYGRD